MENLDLNAKLEKLIAQAHEAGLTSAIFGLQSANDAYSIDIKISIQALIGAVPYTAVASHTPSEHIAEKQPKAAAKKAADKPKASDKAPETLLDKAGEDVPLIAALLALHGTPSGKDYTAEQYDTARELLSSDHHGNTESLASDLLALFTDAGSNPQLLNSALIKIGANVVDWWDDLADHDARVAFFTKLKNMRPDERDAAEPDPVYFKDDMGSVHKFAGRNCGEAFAKLLSEAELSGGDLQPATEKEYKAWLKTQEAKTDVPDFAALRAEGLDLVRTHAQSHRDEVAKIIAEFKGVDANNRPSWKLIPDDQLAGAVTALKALK